MLYYGLISGLPSLQAGKSPELSIQEVKSLVELYSDAKDKALFHLFFQQLDLINFNAVIQKKELWMEGGFMTRDDVEEWHRTLHTEQAPFDQVEQDLRAREDLDATFRIQTYWQTLYNEMMKAENPEVRKLVNYEISLKNFMKSYMERKFTDKLSEHYLEGGWFNRFDYRKLLIGDIRSEHPYLADVLQHMELDDPFERERRILAARWNYFDALCFFDQFDTAALFAWLLKYLDVHKWQYNNSALGASSLELMQNQLNDKLQLSYIS